MKKRQYTIYFERAQKAALQPDVPGTEPDPEFEWRWRMVCRGRIVGASTEGYVGRGDCIENCSSVTGFSFAKPDGAPHLFHAVRVR